MTPNKKQNNYNFSSIKKLVLFIIDYTWFEAEFKIKKGESLP